MDFELSADQEGLRAGARTFLGSACPPSLVRDVFDESAGAADSVDRLWRQMVELDWPSLVVAEEHGGLGLGFVELSVVLEELGRRCAPGPFIPTVTQYTPVVKLAGTRAQRDALLRPVCERGATGTLAVAEDGSRWDVESVRCRAAREGSNWRLEGTKRHVFGAATAEQVAVVARGPEGPGVFVVPASELTVTPVPVADPTQPLATVELEGCTVPPQGVVVDPADADAGARVRRALDEATAALAIAAVGTCRTIFESTLQYCKDRQQYGKPIGSFQALKHRLADMHLALERAASLASFAALTIAEEDERMPIAIAMAKASAGDCQRLLVQDALQLHGGVGFTWEQDLHLYLKRAKSSDLLFGNAHYHRAEVARMLGVAA